MATKVTMFYKAKFSLLCFPYYGFIYRIKVVLS